MNYFSEQLKGLICARHYNLGGAMIGYLEDLQSDSFKNIGGRFSDNAVMSKSYSYKPGSALLILDFKNYYPTAKTLLEDTTGVMKDPCVSFDGKNIAFAWSKDNDGYHIFEMPLDRPDSVRQLTYDLPDYKVSDYEPCYLPNSDIIFNSSRCFVGLSDNFNMVSNLFIMNKDGKYLRRICFDQAHDFHPTVMSDGKIMYSRWEFNDRNDLYVFGVFTMNPDGSLQNEYFGNQLTWPGALPNAREIPNGYGKFLSLVGAMMGQVYQGDLALIDPQKGRNSIDAVQLIAPKRPSNPNDSYRVPDAVKKFQDPYPLDKTWFLISYSENPLLTAKYGLYLMDVDGNRELLAWNAKQSISQPFPSCKRKGPRLVCRADYSKTTAQLTITNAYFGTGIDTSIKAGTIKKIRVIALDYRIYPWFGNTGNYTFTSTPVARWLGSRESKRIIGETNVETDGSASFIVPARTPLYLQLIDTGGCMVQSMRSWMTLQPGEKFDCFGCHEDKNSSPPPPVTTPLAVRAKALEPFYDLADGYLYYPRDIQPILDKHCVSCHTADHSSGLDLSGDKLWTGDLKNNDNNYAERFWCTSYWNLTDTVKRLVNFISSNSRAEGLKPGSMLTSKQSKLITKLQERSGEMAGVSLSRQETDKLCAWIDLCIPHSGRYTDDMKPEHAQIYNNRLAMRAQEEEFEKQNIEEFIGNYGYGGADYNNGRVIGVRQGKPMKTPPDNADFTLQVRFFRGSGILSVNPPFAGTIMVMDLQGRKIFEKNLPDEKYSKNSVLAVPVRIPAGLFIIQLKGKKMSARRMVPVL
jgi:hypothetical protein